MSAANGALIARWEAHSRHLSSEGVHKEAAIWWRAANELRQQVTSDNAERFRAYRFARDGIEDPRAAAPCCSADEGCTSPSCSSPTFQDRWPSLTNAERREVAECLLRWPRPSHLAMSMDDALHLADAVAPVVAAARGDEGERWQLMLSSGAWERLDATFSRSTPLVEADE